MTKPGLLAVSRAFTWSLTVRVALLVVVLASAQACTGWKTTALTPESFPRRDSLHTVRVTLTNGTRVNLQDAQIVADSLRGTAIPTKRPLIVPLSDIEQVQTSHVDAGKTVGLLLILGLIAGAAVGASIAGSVSN